MTLKLLIAMLSVYGIVQSAEPSPNTQAMMAGANQVLEQILESVDASLFYYTSHTDIWLEYGQKNKPKTLKEAKADVSAKSNFVSSELLYNNIESVDFNTVIRSEWCKLRLIYNYLDQATIKCSKKACIGHEPSNLVTRLIFGDIKFTVTSKQRSTFTMKQHSREISFSPKACPEHFSFSPIAALLLFFQEHLQDKNEVAFQQSSLKKPLWVIKKEDESIIATMCKEEVQERKK